MTSFSSSVGRYLVGIDRFIRRIWANTKQKTRYDGPGGDGME